MVWELILYGVYGNLLEKLEIVSARAPRGKKFPGSLYVAATVPACIPAK
jgi:hypothetical protein